MCQKARETIKRQLSFYSNTRKSKQDRASRGIITEKLLQATSVRLTCCVMRAEKCTASNNTSQVCEKKSVDACCVRERLLLKFKAVDNH